MSDDIIDYDRLKELAAELGRPVETLLVEDRNVDPFYAELPERRRAAEWFKDHVWDRFDLQPGAHLRRIHYLLVVQKQPVALPRVVVGSSVYINSTQCWILLTRAANDARYLGLIPVSHFEDHRSDETQALYDGGTEEASLFIEDAEADLSMTLRAAVSPFPELPSLHVSAPKIPQPCVVELWIEKSTMNDIIEPLARQYGVNLTIGTGHISTTRCKELIERARTHDKPMRILTITDYDQHGHSMPVALARKLEFFIRDGVDEIDLQVRPIALTRDQALNLPMKPQEKGSPARFYEHQGVDGVVELDALEAIHPGDLHDIIEREILRYVDPDLSNNIEAAESETQYELDQITEEVHEEHEDEIARLREEYEQMTAEIEEEAERLRQIMEARFRGPFDDLADRVKSVIRAHPALRSMTGPLIRPRLTGLSRANPMRIGIPSLSPAGTTSSRSTGSRSIRASDCTAEEGHRALREKGPRGPGVGLTLATGALMATIKLKHVNAFRNRKPKYVQGFVDRHGKARFYFRRAGFKPVPLPGLPWSPQFMAAYQEALAGQPAPIGIARVKPGSIRALAISYFGSIAFGEMKSNTQYIRRKIIERFCRETDAEGNKFGDKSTAGMLRVHVIKLMAARAAKPGSANGWRKALRAMMQHAVEIGLRADDPTRDVKALRPKSQLGFHRWTEAEIAQFEARHPIGTKPRLAMALGLFTGQARQDVLAMGPQHIQEEVLSWIRKKTERSTATELAIPIHPELRAIIDATPSGHLTFLVTTFGKPFSVVGFSNWFREQCDAAGLPGCSFHGLRKAASVRLAEAGCSTHEIAAITGHASLKEIVRYTATADRKRLAAAAMEKLKARTATVKPAVGFDKKRGKS